MADQKISALTEVTSPNASDMMPIVNAGTTKKVQAQNAVRVVPAIWARAYHNVNQSLSNNTLTALSLNSERWDTDTIHDNSTNNSRLTCKTAGVYDINGCLSFAANSSGIRTAIIRLNGATIIGATQGMPITTGAVTVLSVSAQYVLAVNDYVELVAFQDSGGSLNVLSTANYSPEFMMSRLGA